MDSARYAARIDKPAAQVWALLRWEALEAMIDPAGFAAVDYEERRPILGARRRITFADGSQIVERLERLEEADRHIGYQIVDMGPFPIAEYRGDVRVTPAGQDACMVRFACVFIPCGVTSEQWATQYRTMQAAFVDQIGARLIAQDAGR